MWNQKICQLYVSIIQSQSGINMFLPTFFYLGQSWFILLCKELYRLICSNYLFSKIWSKWQTWDRSIVKLNCWAQYTTYSTDIQIIFLYFCLPGGQSWLTEPKFIYNIMKGAGGGWLVCICNLYASYLPDCSIEDWLDWLGGTPGQPPLHSGGDTEDRRGSEDQGRRLPLKSFF